jgi:hypothetical protein
LRLASQIMVDKAHTVPRDKIGRTIGRINDGMPLAVNRALAVFWVWPEPEAMLIKSPLLVIPAKVGLSADERLSIQRL